MALPAPLKAYHTWLLIAIMSVFVFAKSSIPYWYAEKHTPAGYHFLGQVAYPPDQDMYFSFISQARDGRFVMNNKLTAIPNPPVFVNLEFWLVGFIQHITGISENAVYALWRFMGVILLTTGLFRVARIVLPTPEKIITAMLLALFAGGFGFVFALLNAAHLISPAVTQYGIIDMRYGLLPFQQVLTNPHFSFPHGLILIAYSFFLSGETSGKTRDYVWCGIFFTIIGLVRPYDLIPPFVVFPLYLLVANRSSLFDIKSLARKLLPLLLIIPVLLYNVWLFKFNDIFRYWAQQGLNAGNMPSPLWHYLAYGIIGVLAIIRLLQARANPLSKFEQFLVIWFGATFVFIHLGKLIPAIGWSPQIGVYLAVPLALLACAVKINLSGFKQVVVLSGIVVLALAGNIATVMYYTKNFNDNSKTNIYYARNEEMEAWQWMKTNVPAGNVVLATTGTSLRIAKYTNASVVAAHYSVTPRFGENAALANGLFMSAAPWSDAMPILQKLNVSYIYSGPAERNPGIMKVPAPYLTPVFSNVLVTVYKVHSGASH